eukprot:scaffold13936_cov106-Cylindrotheca_fusiformis.AAC.1
MDAESPFLGPEVGADDALQQPPPEKQSTPNLVVANDGRHFECEWTEPAGVAPDLELSALPPLGQEQELGPPEQMRHAVPRYQDQQEPLRSTL